MLMMLVYVARVHARHVRKHHQHNWGSISPALGPFMLFLRPPDFTKLPKNPGAFPVRFGGAPDAPDAFFLGFQNDVKNTP